MYSSLTSFVMSIVRVGCFSLSFDWCFGRKVKLKRRILLLSLVSSWRPDFMTVTVLLSCVSTGQSSTDLYKFNIFTMLSISADGDERRILPLLINKR